MATPDLTVIEGLTLTGAMNVPDPQILAQVESAIRRGYPQLRRQGANYDQVCLVGGGPSLAQTEGELVTLLRAGAKLVTLNGAYQWALSRNLKPQTQVIIDARPGNARFVDPPVPGCNYLLASQCHPDVWDAVEGREKVWIFHATVQGFTPIAEALNRYYLRRWEPVNGGTTVASRALYALRLLGYLRFHLFGIDCCWDPSGTVHHAYPQPENAGDRRYNVTIAPSDAPDRARTFYCSAWHLKQYEDFLQIIKAVGQEFLLQFHGDGLLAHTLATNAEAVITEADDHGSSSVEDLQQGEVQDRERDDGPVGDDLAHRAVPVGQ